MSVQSTFTLSDLDERARDIFRDVVEGYLETGQPVGSKTLALSEGRSLSPATIRSVMAELSRYGLLTSPHISAGRIPTQIGLRLFVDGLLEIGDLGKVDQDKLEADMLPGSLERAGNFLSARLKGRHLSEARADVLAEIAAGEAQIDAAAAALIEQGLAKWSSPEDKTKRSLIVRGQSHLLDNLEARTDVERIRQLFDDLERKEELIDLLDRAEHADGVKIFIGSENPLFSLSGSSVVIAPYRDRQSNILGALGVIGPTRLNYARVIPMMDYTAQLLGRLLNR